METKVWDKESIQDLLRRSDVAVKRAILALYALQTEDEKINKDAKVRNGVGFTKHDAPFLSDIARKLPLYNMSMTPRQMARARPMVMKYWRQLAAIANEKEARKQDVSVDPVAADAASVDPVVASQELSKTRANPNYGRF